MMRKGMILKTIAISAALVLCVSAVGISAEQQKEEGEKSGTAVVETVKAEEPEATPTAEPIKPVKHFEPIVPVPIPVVTEEPIEEEVAEDEPDSAGEDEEAVTEVHSEEPGIESEELGAADTEEYIGAVNDPQLEYGLPDEEYYEAEPEITVEEYIAPEESTLVEEPAPEPEPVVEEPVPEEPVVEEVITEEASESEWTYYGNCRITHYCDCQECTGQWYGSATASGEWPTAFYTVASGDDLPFGTEVMINGQVYVVQDRGVGNGQIDIFVGDHQLALDMGMYFADVYVKW